VEATFFPGEAHHLMYDRWAEIVGTFGSPVGTVPARHDPAREVARAS
jgi:hypothetical protein